MAEDKFDVTRLERDRYDWDVPLHHARVQRAVEDFMILVKNNEVICPDDQGMLDQFCAFVDDPKVWPLAQMVEPVFRLAKEDRQGGADAGRSTPSLDYVLDRLSRLPLPRNDKNVLTSEQFMLSQRHKQWVEYVVTGGRGREVATSAEQDEVEKRVSGIEKVISDYHAQYPTMSTPRNSERSRYHRKKVDDSEASEANEAGEASEASEASEAGEASEGSEEGGGSRERAPADADLETDELE